MQTSARWPGIVWLGMLLGLIMMWLVFDQLWSVPAAAEMKRTIVSLLRSLAQLAREPFRETEAGH